MGLERVGVAIDREAQARSVELLDSFAVDDGWYTDGRRRQHRLLRAVRVAHLRARPRRVWARSTATRPRATSSGRDAFAPDVPRTGSRADGGAVPFGRSLTYRMAQGSFWGALALADVDALDWPTVRGLALRHLRWWSERPISDRDGVLSVGYGYDNRRMGESYNSAGSPYWCMKAFTMLAAPDDHPFWTVEPKLRRPRLRRSRLRTPGMVLGRDDGQVVGADRAAARGGRSSSRPTPSTRSSRTRAASASAATSRMYGLGATDSMLAVTDPATGVRRVREGVVLSEVADGVALSRVGRRCPGCVSTPRSRAARPGTCACTASSTDRELVLSETGFALPWEPEGFGPPAPEMPERGCAVVTSPWGGSTIVDLRRGDRRGARLGRELR